MNGHSKVNGNGTIEETTTTSIVQTKSDINSNTTIMDVNTTTTATKPGFRLNGNRYAEHEEYSTGKKTDEILLPAKERNKNGFVSFIRATGTC